MNSWVEISVVSIIDLGKACVLKREPVFVPAGCLRIGVGTDSGGFHVEHFYDIFSHLVECQCRVSFELGGFRQ